MSGGNFVGSDAPGTGAWQLRAAADAAKAAAKQLGRKLTDAQIARKTFGISPAAFSNWMSRGSTPRDHHKRTAEVWAGIPCAAWDTPEQRACLERARDTPGPPPMKATG